MIGMFGLINTRENVVTKAKNVTWRWQGDCKVITSHVPSEDGYCMVYSGGKKSFVHRLVWESSNGEIPKGMVIMHTCDNPSCFNLKHLRMGTQRDNMRDKINKGRVRKGFKKLTKSQARSVKFDHPALMDREVAARYGITRSAVQQIRSGRTWGKITDEE